MHGLFNLVKQEWAFERADAVKAPSRSVRVASHHKDGNWQSFGNQLCGTERGAGFNIVTNHNEVRAALIGGSQCLRFGPCLIEGVKAGRFQVFLYRIADDHIVVDDKCVAYERILHLGGVNS